MTARRQFLAGAGFGLVGTLALERSLASPKRRRSLRIAHFTDIHLYPDRVPTHNLVRALHHVQNLKEPPDLLLQGGDAILDALAASREQVAQQWTHWHSVWRSECSLSTYHVLGNHDIFGWGGPHPDPQGKAWAQDELQLITPYYSFERNGWHFLVLDSNHPDPQRGYQARLDATQGAWLVEQLKQIPAQTPICVVSHIPILSACAYFDGPNEASQDWKVPGQWMHLDARHLKSLFRQHPNVKLCLSGHIHLQDRLEYLGVHYLCNGSVSGDVWRGNCQDFDPCYFLIDLFDDGSHLAQVVNYQTALEGSTSSA